MKVKEDVSMAGAFDDLAWNDMKVSTPGNAIQYSQKHVLQRCFLINECINGLEDCRERIQIKMPPYGTRKQAH